MGWRRSIRPNMLYAVVVFGALTLMFTLVLLGYAVGVK